MLLTRYVALAQLTLTLEALATMKETTMTDTLSLSRETYGYLPYHRDHYDKEMFFVIYMKNNIPVYLTSFERYNDTDDLIQDNIKNELTYRGANHAFIFRKKPEDSQYAPYLTLKIETVLLHPI